MNKKYYAVIALVVMALVVISLFSRFRENSNTGETDDYVTFELVESDADPVTTGDEGTGTEAVADAETDADVITDATDTGDTTDVGDNGSGAEAADPADEAGAEEQAPVIVDADDTASATSDASGAGNEAVLGVQTGAEPVTDTGAETVTEAQEPVAPVATYVFRNSRLLNEHYEKHGIEMGFASAAAYEAAASAVITNPAALFKTEKEDGDFIYYLEATNEFVVLSTDGYIRTYFYPSSGKAYFDRQ